MGVFRLAILIVLIILIGRMIYLKQVFRKSLIVSIALCVLLAVHITGTLVNQQRIKSFDDEVYTKIASIPWDDEEYLQSIGFSGFESDEWWTYQRASESGTEDFQSAGTHFSIWVRKLDKETATEELQLSPYDDGKLYMKRNTEAMYDNFFFEFLGLPSGAIRDYDIYCNGYHIWIYERDFETIDRSWAQEFILQI